VMLKLITNSCFQIRSVLINLEEDLEYVFAHLQLRTLIELGSLHVVEKVINKFFADTESHTNTESIIDSTIIVLDEVEHKLD